ncbi:hypothetical protein M3Y97_00169000 [Aphelenchoides bicaudatus]|nr:hypothetical protein M3Y97_00169000 [Aphelenchoides bicaudatus]
MTAIGVPIKVLHEAEGHIITLETTTGEVYRGKLIEAEDNMNCQMQDVTVTLRDGRTQTLENVFVRGSQVRFVILPDMLKNAPMFKNIGRAQKGSQGMGLGGIQAPVRGRGGAFRARGGRGGMPGRGDLYLMGVQGLWHVLEQTGQPIFLNSLEGKRVAIDISIWLCQAAQGYNTYSFGSRAPHIQLLISRISKLLFYRIYPIFVFDGRNVPTLKKQVLKERALARHMDDIRMSKKQKIMLEQLAKQQLESSNDDERGAAEQQLLEKLIQQRPEDKFELPDLPSNFLNRNIPNWEASTFFDEQDFELSEDSGSETDDDDFEDVSDGEETIKAILQSVSKNETDENVSDSDLPNPELPDLFDQDEPTTSEARYAIDQKKEDMKILSEQAKNGYLSISQRINMKSLAAQPSSRYLIEDDSLLNGTSARQKETTNNRRRSAPPLTITNTSPKKSTIFHVAGTAEDDWMPESVAGTANSMAPKRPKLDNIDLNETMDNTIVADCQQLLTALGLPYLIANGEAEAQCVALEKMKLCDGVVSDDSDVWVFGVKHCYRNLFSRKADVTFFDADKIQRVLDLDRTKFVAIAMLAGGDYCHGFNGVGCMNAIKIIKEIGDGLARLQRIRQWLDAKAIWESRSKKQFRESAVRRRLRKRIETRNEDIRIETFPSEEVFAAYMCPDVNQNSQRFRWLPIEFDNLHDFLQTKIGWSAEELRAHTFGALDKWNDFIVQNN